MSTVHLLSGGAAEGLMTALAPGFETETGFAIDGTYGAVGAMRERLEAGAPADVLVLTRAIIDDLARKGAVLTDSIADVGSVETAIAVRAGAALPEVADPEQLRQALLAADEIVFPDPELATAGIHFAKVLEQLGVAGEVEDRVRVFPDGRTAMRHLAASPAASPIGCTQTTEIVSTPGVSLVGPLPPGCSLLSTYTAAVCCDARHREEARRLVALLTAQESAAARQEAGFRSSVGGRVG